MKDTGEVQGTAGTYNEAVQLCATQGKGSAIFCKNPTKNNFVMVAHSVEKRKTNPKRLKKTPKKPQKKRLKIRAKYIRRQPYIFCSDF